MQKTIAYRESTILEIMRYSHKQPYTTEYLANEFDFTRQDIAPYVTELIDAGNLIKIVGVGMNRGRAIQVFGATCQVVQDPQSWLIKGIAIAKSVIYDRLHIENVKILLDIMSKEDNLEEESISADISLS